MAQRPPRRQESRKKGGGPNRTRNSNVSRPNSRWLRSSRREDGQRRLAEEGILEGVKPLAKNVTGVTASGIRRFFDLAAQVEGLLSLGVGEPKYPAPVSAKRAAIRAMECGHEGYTWNFGC